MATDPAPVLEIVPDREVRKQAAFLKNISDATAPGRDIDLCGTVEQHFTVNFNTTAIRPQEACNHVDQTGFSRTRWPEQGRGPAFARERDFQREFAEVLFHLYGQHGHAPCRRAVARRASHSEESNAAKQMTTEMKTSLRASASPPGTWIKL